MRATGVFRVCGQGPVGKSLGLGQLAFLLIDDAQGHTSVGVLGRNLQAAIQQLYAFVELTKVHIAEAQVLEEIGTLGILAEEFLQVDPGLVQLAGGEELEGAGEVVLVGHGEISPENGRGDLYYNRIPAWI